MLPTKIYKVDLTANGTFRLFVQGEYFKVMSATGSVTVQSEFGRLDDLIAGQGLESTPFSWLLLTDTSGSANALRVLVGDEKFIDGMSGAIEISRNRQPISASFANAAATVTNASAQLLAADVNRQYLLIQNNDSAGDIVLSFGAAATLVNGIIVKAGQAYEMPTTQSSQAIFAIGTIANNTKIVTITG